MQSSSFSAFPDNNQLIAFRVQLTVETPSIETPVWEGVDWSKLGRAKFARFTLNPEKEELATPLKVMSTQATEFPSVPQELSTLKHRYAYTSASHQDWDVVSKMGNGPSGAILKIDAEEPGLNEAYAFEPFEFVGEPIFVPKVGADVKDPAQEDKGYVVVHVINGIDLTTDLVILDVEGRGRLEEGPVARVRLPTYIPHGLHGEFVEGLTFDF